MGTGRAVLEVARWSAGAWLLWRVPGCAPAGAGSDGAGDAPVLAGVSVVIPARDEEATLPALLASLAAQEPAAGEVVVVDDSSADSTAAVARRAGARVVDAGPLPEGWAGKPWACRRGADAAGGDVLVFLDADTTVEAGGLARLVATHRRRGGLVSVQPFHLPGRPYEALSAFFNVVSMMGVGAFAARPARVPAGAFGPCLVCRREDYERAGGHGAPGVRGAVVEDVALARRFGAAGLPVSVLGGRGTVRFRMYPGGPAQLVEGWTKNFATGAAATPPARLVLVSAWLSGCLAAWWWLPAPVGAAVYAAYALQLRWMLGRIGRFPAWVWAAHPIALAFFLVVFARSAALTALRREVQWRGRTLPTGARRR